jgi:hypothetical protein
VVRERRKPHTRRNKTCDRGRYRFWAASVTVGEAEFVTHKWRDAALVSFALMVEIVGASKAHCARIKHAAVSDCCQTW